MSENTEKNSPLSELPFIATAVTVVAAEGVEEIVKAELEQKDPSGDEIEKVLSAS